MSAKSRWVGAIVGLLVGNVVATGVLIAESHHGASRVIPAYYEQAVRYDDVIAQHERDVKLGWKVELAITGDASVRVHARSGAPLDGARVRIAGNARATGAALDAPLVGQGDGMYRAQVAHAPGWYDLTVTVERGGDTFVERAAIEAR